MQALFYLHLIEDQPSPGSAQGPHRGAWASGQMLSPAPRPGAPSPGLWPAENPSAPFSSGCPWGL